MECKIKKEENVYKILIGKTQGKRALGRTRHRWENTINMDRSKIGYDRIPLAQN